MFLYTIGVVVAFLYLLLNKDGVRIDLLDSEILGDVRTRTKYRGLASFLALIWPYTMFEIFRMKIKHKQLKMKKTLLVVALLVGIYLACCPIIEIYNTNVTTQVEYEQKMSERQSVLDRVTKIIHQKLELAQINDASYYKNLAAIADYRKDGQGLFMKWVTENNPNVNYGEVASMYRDVSASISNERDYLISVERQLQSIDANYKVQKRTFPSNVILMFRPASLGYEAISTTDNKKINGNGVDEKVNL